MAVPLLAKEKHNEVEDARADQGGAGNCEHPGPNDAASDTPAHGGEPARRADSDKLL